MGLLKARDMKHALEILSTYHEKTPIDVLYRNSPTDEYREKQLPSYIRHVPKEIGDIQTRISSSIIYEEHVHFAYEITKKRSLEEHYLLLGTIKNIVIGWEYYSIPTEYIWTLPRQVSMPRAIVHKK